LKGNNFVRWLHYDQLLGVILFVNYLLEVEDITVEGRAVQQVALSLHLCGPQRHNKQHYFAHIYQLEWKNKHL